MNNTRSEDATPQIPSEVSDVIDNMSEQGTHETSSVQDQPPNESDNMDPQPCDDATNSVKAARAISTINSGVVEPEPSNPEPPMEEWSVDDFQLQETAMKPQKRRKGKKTKGKNKRNASEPTFEEGISQEKHLECGMDLVSSKRIEQEKLSMNRAFH